MKMHVKSTQDVLRFGKFKGLAIEEVLYNSHDYINWMIKNDVVTFAPDVLEWLKKEISSLHLQGYNSSSGSDWGGYESAMDDPLFGLDPH